MISQFLWIVWISGWYSVHVCVCVCRPPCGVPASGLVFPLHSCYVYVEICMCGVCIVEFVFGVCMWSVESPLCSLYVETLGGLHTFEWTLCSESVWTCLRSGFSVIMDWLKLLSHLFKKKKVIQNKMYWIPIISCRFYVKIGTFNKIIEQDDFCKNYYDLYAWMFIMSQIS